MFMAQSINNKPNKNFNKTKEIKIKVVNLE